MFMSLQWIDSLDIAIALSECYPEQDPKSLHFPLLMKWILELDDFNDEPSHCSERILEAIQQAWIDEM